MSYQGHVIVGSGMKPQLDIPNNQQTGKRHLTGTQVVVINPEDASAGGPFLVTQIDVTTSATRIPSNGLAFRRSIAIRNNGSSTVYLGHNNSVTTSNGFPLAANEVFHADVTGNVAIWAIADATVDVRVVELA